MERFWKKVDKTETCWNWTAAKSRLGYGQFRYNKKTLQAHRFAYELIKGEIPNGLVIDHLCRNRACVNPDHLEPVTHTINVQRGIAGEVIAQRSLSKTHCPQGHKYDETNTYYDKLGHRHCRICRQAQGHEYRRKNNLIVGTGRNYKLTEEKVRAIRNDQRSLRTIARDYGISLKTVIAVKKRRSWKHVL